MSARTNGRTSSSESLTASRVDTPLATSTSFKSAPDELRTFCHSVTNLPVILSFGRMPTLFCG